MTLLKVHGAFIKLIKSSVMWFFLGSKWNLILTHYVSLVWLKGMMQG